MSRLESLPPDLHAVLSLLLRQRKNYAEVAGMLGIEVRAVHDRAHAALALLAPRQARELTAAEREQVGEYLLSQQPPAGRLETRAFLERSPSARAWAQALGGELTSLAAQPLPEIPASVTAPKPAPVPPHESASAAPYEPSAALLEPANAPAPSSRVGGAVVLGVLAVVVVVAVLLIVGVGGGGSHGSTNSTTSSTGTGQSAGTGLQPSGAGTTSRTGTGTSTSTGAAKPAIHGKALVLTPPDPATSKAAGVAYVLAQDGKRAFYLFTKGLPVTTGGAFYAVWLEGSATASAYPLGSLPAQGANGLIEGGGPLPSDAGSFHHIIVTRETSRHPTHPGQTVLSGTFTAVASPGS